MLKTVYTLCNQLIIYVIIMNYKLISFSIFLLKIATIKSIYYRILPYITVYKYTIENIFFNEL